MSAVTGKCTRCGTVLTVDTTLSASICDRCGNPFLVSKAIEYYNESNNASAAEARGDNPADFEIKNDELVKYTGNALSVSIPDGITSVNQKAFFENATVTAVTFPDSITTIGAFAFQGCKALSDLKLPPKLESIGHDAFRGCSALRYLTVPNSVTNIGFSAFAECTSLTSVTLPDRQLRSFDWFNDCPNISIINASHEWLSANAHALEGTPFYKRWSAQESKSGKTPFLRRHK